MMSGADLRKHAAMDESVDVRERRGSNVSSDAGSAQRVDQAPCCGVRLWLLAACAVGIATQTSLRSVPNLVMNGETGMAQEFGWSNTQRGEILAAFGWGYTLTQIPGGLVSQLIGPKRTLLVVVAVGSIAGLLIPLGSRINFIIPLALNFIIGMAQGPLFPVLNGLLARWMRPSEMGRGNAMLGAAWNLGQVAQFLLSPLLLGLAGWPACYYFFAGAGCIWCVWWQIVAADSPEAHPRISAAELEGIQAGSALVVVAVDGKGAANRAVSGSMPSDQGGLKSGLLAGGDSASGATSKQGGEDSDAAAAAAAGGFTPAVFGRILCQVKKRPSCAIYTKMIIFTKAGSGQT
jgi:MFS family permease